MLRVALFAGKHGRPSVGPVYGNIASPACWKFLSNVRALRMPRFSMRTKEVQSVKDHRLSDRRTKSFQAAAKAGDSTLTRRRFFD